MKGGPNTTRSNTLSQNQGRPQADARDARASTKFGQQFYFLLKYEFSRFFSFTPTLELISFHFL